MVTARQIKAQAHELGFDLCGIAPAEEFPELARLREWIDRGHAGDMTYLHRSASRRADVRRALASARSVIVTATHYNTDRPYSVASGDPTRARIARYAWGDDYHDVIGRRMEALLAWMREQAGAAFEALAYVDTGPVQERVYAQYAGIGWIGKNTCVINPDIGSWILLGEIVCSLSLEPDTPALDQCGTCTLCLEACPTGAIVEPWRLDATRCLSYLTIELNRAVPEPLRPAVGAHIFGCDICQDVCPWNATPAASGDEAWQPRPALDRPRLVDLWRRSDAELEAMMAGGPLTRAGLRSLRRNLAVAMGNAGDAETARALAGDRSDASIRDPLVSAHVEWARARAR
jgi:epoxyqueuosine reductase